MSEPSEEKKYDATPRKLKKAREKGQVAQSRDVVTALGSIAALIYVWQSADTMQDGLDNVFDATYRALELPFAEGIKLITAAGWEVTVAVVAPLILIIAAVAVFGSMAMTGGPIFAFDPLLPRFDKVNPADGFKRLFGARGWATFGMNCVKVIVLLVAVFFVLRGALQPLVYGARGGLEGSMAVFDGIARELVVVMSVLMLASAAADLAIQKHMFRREMRMTRTEMKQEQKEQEGDPQLTGQRKRIARRAVEHPSGLRLATCVITDGPNCAIALRYVDGETPVPVVVARAKGAAAGKMAARAPSGAKAFDHEVAGTLTKVEPGDYVPSDLVPRVAEAMRAAGVL